MVVLHEVKESAALTCKPWATGKRLSMASTKLLQNCQLVDFLNLSWFFQSLKQLMKC